MRVLLQRVIKASVAVDAIEVGSIGRGYLLFLGVLRGDTADEARWLAAKISKLRLFDGVDGEVNDRSVLDVGGAALVVSQFTLAGETQKGNRPDYTTAEEPVRAEELYRVFVQALQIEGIASVATGTFGAYMQVELCNDGPVTLLLEKMAQSTVA